MISRDEALALVRERIPNRNLVNHCLATEYIMRALAEHDSLASADVDRWGLAGLLHDLDYAETADDPERHGYITAEELAGDVDDEMLRAILAHAGVRPSLRHGWTGRSTRPTPPRGSSSQLRSSAPRSRWRR